jgi:hypothetical protein
MDVTFLAANLHRPDLLGAGCKILYPDGPTPVNAAFDFAFSGRIF